MKFIPPPRFFFGYAVGESEKVTTKGVLVVSGAAQLRVKVLGFGAKAHEMHPDIEVGDVIHVMPGNVNILDLDPLLRHCVVFDEAVLLSQKGDECHNLKPVLDVKLNRIERVDRPAGIVDGRGLKLDG